MLAVEGPHLDAVALGEERISRRVIRREGNGEGGWREGETDGEGDHERTHRSQTVGGEAGPHDTSSISSNLGGRRRIEPWPLLSTASSACQSRSGHGTRSRRSAL